MTPDIDKAKAALKRGASLHQAAMVGGFDLASHLDLALWWNLGRRTPPAPLPTEVEAGNSTNHQTLKALLAKRDAKIKALLAEGYSPAAMAERFGLAERVIVEQIAAR